MINNHQLFPFQVEDVAWLEAHPRCILGSSMGVGKLIEGLALCEAIDPALVLVICPKSLVSEWVYQIEEWLGPDWLERFVVFNYEKLRNRKITLQLMKYSFDLIIFDECHKIKNRKAKQTQGAFLVAADQSQRILLMSGTPILNNPQDLYPLLKIVNPKLYSSYSAFVKEFCVVEQLSVPPFPTIILPGVKNVEKLNGILAKCMIRREKDIIDLPAKTYRTVPAIMDDEQLYKYMQMEEDLFTILDNGEKITAPVAIAQLIRLRQICLEPNLLSTDLKTSTPSSKTLIIKELVEDADGPVIIFTFFETYARILSAELTKAKITNCTYTGKDKTSTRAQTVKDFQKGKYKALIGTITSMGLGLTLTISHTVIFSDLFWTPAINEQAEDRTHRIGQKHPVTIIDIWAKGTIEDHMHRVIKNKKDVFDKVIRNTDVMEETIASLRAERATRETYGARARELRDRR